MKKKNIFTHFTGLLVKNLSSSHHSSVVMLDTPVLQLSSFFVALVIASLPIFVVRAYSPWMSIIYTINQIYRYTILMHSTQKITLDTNRHAEGLQSIVIAKGFGYDSTFLPFFEEGMDLTSVTNSLL